MVKEKNWFKLDNAGKMYSSITSARSTTLFRISVDLKEKVDKSILQKALDNCMDRFPYLNVNLKRGLFWYYFDRNSIMPKVEKEKYYPCMYLEVKKKNIFLFRVLYYNKKISVEFSHIITDGTGATFFLKVLIIEYFRLKGIYCENIENIYRTSYIPKIDEIEDSFKKYYDKKIPSIPNGKSAFHFPFKLCEKGEYYIVIGIVDVDVLIKKAKEYDSTITQFLTAIYFKSILEFIKSINCKKKPIVMNVPVNLRKMYSSKTMKNFFISLTPTIDPRLGKYTFEEIIKYTKNYMKLYIDKKYINKIISRNVKNERSIFLRVFPLILKDFGMPYIYNFFGEKNYTTGFSNFGKVTMPKEIDNYIERIEVYPPPSIGNIIKVTAISYNNKMHISFGKLTENKDIEMIFFRNVRKMGIKVKVEKNNYNIRK